jgi:polyhydroxybutyrate depolymerase
VTFLKPYQKIILLIILIILFLPITGCIKKQKRLFPRAYGPGDYNFTLNHDKLKRKYIVHVPPRYNEATPLPLVLAIHGGGGSAKGSVDYFRFNPLADQENFIVVYPEGIGLDVLGKHFGAWNGGTCCGPPYRQGVDDVQFISKMLDKLTTDYSIDSKRIYATGMSNGAIMSYGLACGLSERIAAIAPVGSIGHLGECVQSRPVPTLHIHGKADPCAIYEGCDECVSCFGK